MRDRRPRSGRSSGRTHRSSSQPSSSAPIVQLTATASRAALSGRRYAMATPPLIRQSPHKRLAPTRKMAEEQDGAAINRLEIEVKLRLHVISLGSHLSYIDLKVALRTRTCIGKSHAADRVAIS
jgi:hypothetical protein